MEVELVKKFLDLKQDDFDSITNLMLIVPKDNLLKVLEDVINFMPFLSKKLSDFFIYLVSKNPEYLNIISNIILNKSDLEEINFSKFTYAKSLGFKIEEKTEKESAFNNFIMENQDFPKFNNKIENLEIYFILKEFKFDKNICYTRLLEYSSESVIDVIYNDFNPFNFSILVNLCNNLNFLKEFVKNANKFKNKNEIISAIFINNYKEEDFLKKDEKTDLLKNLLQKDVLEYCLDVVNKKYLGLLLEKEFEKPYLDSISYEEFKEKIFKNKPEFLRNFVLLSSPSVTHFLTYLEIYKQEFVLTKKQQKDFVKFLTDFHVNNKGYLKIILSKLEKFGIIKN